MSQRVFTTLTRCLPFLLLLFSAPALAQPEGFALPTEMTSQAVFSCRDLTISGNSIVSSEGLVAGVGEEGHARSNSDVHLDGSVEVHGDVIAGGTVVRNGKPALVTGEVREGEAPQECRPIDLAALSATLEAQNDNDLVPPSDKGKVVLGRGKDKLAFELKGSDGVTLPSGVYFFSSFKVTGNSTVRLEGPVYVLVTGEVDVSGSGRLNPEGSPYAFRLWTTGSDVQVTSGAEVRAFVYAPDGAVLVGGQSTVVGGVTAGQVDVVGGSRIRRLVDDQPPQVTVDTPADGDSVLECEIPVRGTVTDAEGTVTLTVNGEDVAVTGDGSFDTTTSLYTDDPGLVVVEATDLQGNVTTVEVRVTIVPPELELVSPAPGSLVGTRLVDLSGTSGTADEVTIGGLPAIVTGGGFTFAGFDLGDDGLKTLTVVGKNCGGETTATFVLDLDTLAPEVSIDSPEPDTLFGASPITVSGIVKDAHLESVVVNGVTATVNGERFTALGVALEEGSNELVAVATDALGRVTSSAPVAVVLDTTAPTVTITDPEAGVVIDTRSITVSGDVSDANLDTVTVNGVPASVDGMSFSAPGVTLEEGDNFLVAEAVDQVGNSATSPSVVVVLDTLPPQVAIDETSFDALTSAETVTVRGTVSDAHLEQVSVNGVIATVTGETFVAEDVPLEEGPNDLVAEAVDILDHRSTTPPSVVVRDSLPPELAITSPEPDAELVSNTVEVSGTVRDDHLDKVTVNGVEATVTGETWTVTLELDDGTPEITARAVDTLGQATQTEPLRVVIDTLPPVVRITPPAESLVDTPEITVTGTIVEPHLDVLTVSDVAAAVDGEDFTVTGVPLEEGPNEITAYASDTFGHEATSAPVLWVLDTQPPEIAITAPEDDFLTSAETVTVTGTVSDAHLDTVTVNGVDATVTDGAFTAEVPLPDEGANVLVATATDLLGKSTSDEVTVILDTLPPEISITEPADGFLTGETTVAVSGPVSDAHLDTVTVNGVDATVTGGVFTAVVPLPEEGANVLVATATDRLGKSTSAQVTVVLDTRPPALAILTPAAGERFDTHTVQVTGTVIDPHLEVVTVNDLPATVAGETWSIVLDLPDGTPQIQARAVDTLGHGSVAGPIEVVVDTTAPEVAITPPAEDLVSTPSITVIGTFVEPHLGSIVVRGVTAVVDGNTWTALGVALEEGTNEVTAVARDTFNHETTSAPVVWVLDTLPPVVAIDTPVEGEIVTSLAATVTGPVEDAHLATVTVNGTPAEVADGRFTATLPLTDGANTLTVVATDELGQSSEASVTVFLDTLPPGITLDTPSLLAEACLAAGEPTTLGGRFSDPNPATGQDGQPPAVALRVTPAGGSAAVSYTGVLSADGRTWTATGVDLGAVDGVAAVTVVATDVIGNVSRTSRAFPIDATAPELNLNLDGSPFPGTAAGATPPAGAEPVLFNRRLAIAASVTDSAHAAPPDAVLTLDGAPYTAGTEITAEGDHLVVATVTDCAGHTTTVHAFFHVDLTPPALLSTLPAQGATLDVGVATFRGVSDPDLASATVGGKPATVSGANFALSSFPWVEGENQVTIELTDAAGNRSTHERTFTVRSLGPAVEITESGLPIAANQLFLRAVKPEVRASDPEATLVATLNGEPFVSGTEITTNGAYTLEATATDALDRSATTSATFRVDVGAGPRITITEPLSGVTLPMPSVTVRGTVTGDQPRVSVNGVDATVDGELWTAADVPLEPNVLNDLLAVAYDRRDRSAQTVVSVLVTDAGPTLLILEPADGAVTNRRRVDVAGTVVGGIDATADGQVRLQAPTGPVVALVDPDGGWRAKDVELQSGANLITAQVNDPQGFVSQASVTVHSDSTPPTIRITVDGQPLEDGAVFSRAVTLEVEVQDDTVVAETAVRLNGQVVSDLPSSDVEVAEDGGYVVSVVARDAASNQARGERSFVLDLSGCALTELEPEAGAAVLGDAFTLRGRSGAAQRVRVRVPFPSGEPQVFTAQLADGTFLAGDVPLPVVGTNEIEIVCVDPSGASRVVQHPIDRLPAGSGPTVTITSPTSGQLFTAATVEVTGTVAGASSVTVNGLPAVIEGSTFRVAAVPLSEGPNILGARAVDPQGRTARDRRVVSRDSTPPKVSITSPDNNTPLGLAGAAPAAIDVSGAVDLDNEPHLDRVTVTSAQGSVVATVDPATGAWLAPAVPLDPAALPDDVQTLTATAVDTLGLTGTATVDVTLDVTGPAILLGTPPDLETYDETSPAQIPVTGEAWAQDGAAILVNGARLDPATLVWDEAAEDGRRHTSLSLSIGLPDKDGPFGLIARVSELDGRYAQTRRLLSKDSVPPEVVEMVPADGAERVDPNTLLLVLFTEPVLHASLTAPNGLTLLRESSGETVVGGVTVAGNAVGLAPGVALAAGEFYRFRADVGVTDVAGHPLVAPFEVRFQVAQEATSAAPVVDPLPAVVCTDELVVTGMAAPGATVKVRDGKLTFTGFADATGAFAVSLPVSSNGFHLLHVFAVDEASGAVSPETSVVVRIDCSAPTVSDAVFDRATGALTVTFSEEVDPATITLGTVDDSLRLSDAEDPQATPQAGTVTVDGAVVTLQLDDSAEAFWRDRPVRLQAGPPAADLEGNAMLAVFEVVFFPGGSGGDLAGGFLFGEAWDDETGRPLAGVSVRLYGSSSALPGTVQPSAEGVPLATATTEGRGRFTVAGEVPAGRYVFVLEQTGYTRVVRRLALEPSTGAVPFDSRLTPLAPAAGTLDPSTGGRAELAGTLVALEADPGALPGTTPLNVRLTPLSSQGLPDFLPLGWTPAAAAEVRLVAGGEPLPDGRAAAFGDAGVRLDLPLAAWVLPGDELTAARYDLATGLWTSLDAPTLVDGPAGELLARIVLEGPGAVAVVVPDQHEANRPPALPQAAGEALQGVALPSPVPALLADLVLDPPVIAPTGRSRARVVARSADGVSPWPSGLAVQAFLEEKLILAAGAGQLLEAPFSADLVVYHERLTAEEQGATVASAAGAVEWNVSPSPRAAQVLLESGFEDIRLFPFPDAVERGSVLGPAGGSVESADGVEVILPEGALVEDSAVEARLLSVAELAALPAVAGFDTLAGVRLDLQGQVLARSATVKLPLPPETPDETAGDPRVVLAELVETPADFRGTYARLVAKTGREEGATRERLVAGPDFDGGLPLDGVVHEGLYLVLAARQPIGFATGFVSASNGAGIEGSRVTADGLGTADITPAGGRYVVPVPAGSDVGLTAVHPFRDDTGSATIPSVVPGQEVGIDITLDPAPPRILSLLPENGAVEQPVGTTVAVLFNEALDPTSVGPATLKLELADQNGNGLGVLVSGTVSLSADALRVVFASDLPLPPGRLFLATFSGGVRDAGGTFYDGAVPVRWTFTTSRVVVPGGLVDADKFHVEIPVDGVARVFADPGALPAAQAGQPKWSVSPFFVGPGPAADPVRETLPALNDGSFEATLGHPPEHPVTIESEIWVTVIDPVGQIAGEFRVGPFASPDGLAFVASPGEELVFVTAEGNVVEVPAGAFDKATIVSVRNLPFASLRVDVPDGMALGAFIDVDFEGEAKETLRISVPAPADAVDGSRVLVGAPVQLPWGRRLRMLTIGGVLTRDGERFLSNDPSLQPEPSALRAGSDFKATPQTCRDVQQAGQSRCAVQSLLTEFRLRSSAAWFYGAGAELAAGVGSLGGGALAGIALGVGASNEVFYNTYADSWVYQPVPSDWNGGFILPVIVDEPLEIVRRDIATGWILSSQTYDPITDGSGLASLGILAGGEKPSRPLLVSARPFHLLPFRAPEDGETTLLRLEIEAESLTGRQVTLRGAPGFPLPKGTTVSVFDLAPALTRDPKTEPSEPIEGPKVKICDDGGTWQSSAMAGSDEMLAVLAPGDVDPSRFDAFEFQFNQALVSIEDKSANEVAVLQDLGPAESCETSGGEGYPRDVPISPKLDPSRSRLLVTPLSTLPAGHRFRLELEPQALETDAEMAVDLFYWDSAPHVFEFATKPLPGEVVGSIDETFFPFDGVTTARDLVKLGNLMVVSTDAAKIVAIDVTDPSKEDEFRPYALQDAYQIVRPMATDGHNRVFYSALFGSVWAVKTLRLEDIRKADANCGSSQPGWAQGLPCFKGTAGSVQIAWALGSLQAQLTASEWTASSSSLPAGSPADIEVLAQDEKGRVLELGDFYKTYLVGGSGGNLDDATPDDEGIYTFDIELKSTLKRAEDGEIEPSLDPETAVPPSGVPEWRSKVCGGGEGGETAGGEEAYDRFQRVTVDNLTTGQSWSFDIENEWPVDPEAQGDGTYVLHGLKARRGDQLQVRYNIRAIGYIAIVGSGITVVDLNRFYHLPLPYASPVGLQCGRRLGKFEGQLIDFPDCAGGLFGAEPDGIALTTSVAVQSETGCDTGQCRGSGRIDLYSPLLKTGVVHTIASETQPGGVSGGTFGSGEEAIQLGELAACIELVGERQDFAWLRDIALANDVTWTENGIRGSYGGAFQSIVDDSFEPSPRTGDLLFLSMGMAGIYVFDVSNRFVGQPTLIGHLYVKDHAPLLLHVDTDRGLLFAGGTDYTVSPSRPLIDIWEISTINAAPGTDFLPQPKASIHVPWSANHMAIDQSGTGLIYTWGGREGPVAVPFENPRFVFSGLYLPEKDENEPPPPEGERPNAVLKTASQLVPLGVPLEVTPKAEEDNREDNERKATAAFKVRLALPGVFGPEVTAKVQGLRALPDERFLGQEDVGAAVAMPGGPGWPENEVVVTLRRIGSGPEESLPQDVVDGESGRFANVYNLYESKETILLLADPRARRDYHLQDVPDDDSTESSKTADEKAQCRRCDWPSYLPDPKSPEEQDDPELEDIKELLAGGRYVRAFLSADPDSPDATRQATEKAIAFFKTQGQNFRLPQGWVRVAAPADAVPSPLQVSLAEPAQNPAIWTSEADAAVYLTGGEALFHVTDHFVAGRKLPFSFDRTYRSGLLGYGPLGAAGWSATVFSHLREIGTTGEVEYYDGAGHVWRFYPRDGEPPSDEYEDDPAGSYYAPKGLYLRLQKLAEGQGWRLLHRDHTSVYYDGNGRMTAVSDRHRRGKADPQEQGSTTSFLYDPFEQLVGIRDDLGRDYHLEYFDDPRPESEGGDGPHYGLLKKITDFIDRTVEYEYSEDRALEKVLLPEVSNPVAGYSQFSYEGQSRATLEYRYDPQMGVTDTESDTTAILHGEYAKLRLDSVLLPEFVDGVSDVPRVRFEYDHQTGRIATVGFPTPTNQNNGAVSVEWKLDYTGVTATAGPAKNVTVRSPWGHDFDYTLESGRTEQLREELEIVSGTGDPVFVPATTRFSYAEDGRMISVLHPDGGKRIQCYPDGAGLDEAGGTGGCPNPELSPDPQQAPGPQPPKGGVDRLQIANVVKTIVEATTLEGQGNADYTRVSTGAEYQEDNQPSMVVDGLDREIEIAVPMAKGEDQTVFRSEGVASSYEFDDYGRVKRYDGGKGADPVVQREFHDDATGRPDAGLMKRIEYGVLGAAKYSYDLKYDDAYNVEERRTSYGAFDKVTYDKWDRPVRVISGLSDGRYDQVGAGEGCSEEKGAVVERAYDGVGHVVRERRLQDYVDAQNITRCRFVETHYRYNAREQLVAIEQTHVASPDVPGEVIAAQQQLVELVYDQFGRLSEKKELNLRDPDLVTRISYDEVGRVSGMKVGDAGERRRGYDIKSRVVVKTDGDEGVWRGEFDAWDRVYQQVLPTGAVVQRFYDEAHNLIEEKTWDRDPFVNQDAELLNQIRSHVNSFGQVDRIAKVLAVGEGGEEELRVLERTFDDTGRLVMVLSGPPKQGSDELDRSQARRELEILYELEGGRVLLESYGGAYGDPPLYANRYFYEADNKAPWADRMDFLESVPGQEDLAETFSTSYRRDVLGRPVEKRHTDGRIISLSYDRTADTVIRARTGAGTTLSITFDGRGSKIRDIRPNNRGVTTYAYDFDGRLRRQSATTASGDPWDTLYTYDSARRLVQIDHEDQTTESFTYNPDNTAATHTTRDGVLVTYSYDAANRPLSAVPSAARGLAASLVPLDSGDFTDYDALSRMTQARRGAALGGAVDPALTVTYPNYDLADRPESELVGDRSPLTWRYDTWDRPVELTLPEGVGRDAQGAFLGYVRSFDTLDRLTNIGGAGEIADTPLGMSLVWGGKNRLYGGNTRGTLGTAFRFGYLGGSGAQPPGDSNDDTARWRLGTLTWGAQASSPTAVPDVVWGQFGYGWRGTEGDLRDGTKIGRVAVNEIEGGGLDLFAGLGWSWGYDAGVRLNRAGSGRGDLLGQTSSDTLDNFRYEYDKGDELQRIIRESTGEISELEHGAYGRIIARNGVPFSYDEVGRRTDDDRFVYHWNWRGELITVTVKEDGSGDETELNPYAGHQIRYEYDAKGRMMKRWHLGPFPDGETDDQMRPILDKRVYLWEGQGLLAEASYNDAAETQLRWRKSYIPGAKGLDDAYQVAVEVVNLPGSPFAGTHLYTYLRDEIGTVIGVVAEDEGSPEDPAIPARYLYTPYGTAHVETGLETRWALFESGTTNVGSEEQVVSDEEVYSSGALRIRMSASLDESSIAAGFVVEKLAVGSGWVVVDPSELVVARDDAESSEVVVLLRNGWQRGTSYRVLLTAFLNDTAGRRLGSEETLEWSIPNESSGAGANPPVIFETVQPMSFSTTFAASDTIGGRFPGGQSYLFQGLWADPVTGLYHARARWYDSGSVSWLNEDPARDIDSPNLYAFVAWQPNMAIDPTGLCVGDIPCPETLKSLGGFVYEAGVTVVNIAKIPIVMIQKDNERKRERMIAMRDYGYEAYQEVLEQQVEEGKENIKQTAKGMIPLYGTYQDGSKIIGVYEREGSFEGGRQVFRATFGLAGDVTLVYGVTKGVQGLRGAARGAAASESAAAATTGAVEYGSTDLSKMAMDLRKMYGWEGGNVAVFEYVDEAGEVSYYWSRNIRSSHMKVYKHAEQVVKDIIEKEGLDPKNVRRVYTELSPCRTGHRCAEMLADDVGQAEITYSFEHPDEVADLGKAIDKLGVDSKAGEAASAEPIKLAEEAGTLQEWN